MGRHNHVRAGFDCRLKGNQFKMLQFIICAVNQRKAGMAVRIGIPMAREMFHHRHGSGIMKPGQISASECRGSLRII